MKGMNLMYKYRASGSYNPEIKKLKVAKETEKCVFYFDTRFSSSPDKTTRENKSGSDHAWFDKWSDAHAWLFEKAQSRVMSARRNLENANSRLGNVKGMKEPA